MPRLSLFAILLMFSWCVVSTTPLRADPKEVVAGIVVDFAGLANNYEIRRGNKTLRPRVFFELLDRDKVVVRNRDGYLRINFTDGSVVRVDPRTNPYEVRVRGAAPSGLDALFSLVGDAMDRREDLDRVATSSRGRGAPRLVMRGLTDRTALVCTGFRRIGASWVGGTPPYRLQVRDPLGNIVLDSGVIDASEVLTLENRGLTEGEHAVAVRDARGAIGTGGFVVVSSQKCIQVDAVANPHWLEAEPRGTLAASWLASGPRSAHWTFEAYLRLIDLERRYPPARALMDVIAIAGSLDDKCEVNEKTSGTC